MHDGQNYLIERYAIVLTPGLQLFELAPLPTDLTVFAGGLTQARQGFSALRGVAEEIIHIQQKASTTVLLDQDFTRDLIQHKLTDADCNVVHLGTHGQFSSRLDETFLLTWRDRINIKDLCRWLLGQPKAQEQLNKQTSQTAKGDDRGALGEAGQTH